MPDSPQLDLCRLLLESGRTHLESGQSDQAARALTHAIELARAHGFAEEETKTLSLLGRLHLRSGVFGEARNALETCLTLLPAGTDDLLAAEVLSDLAEIYRKQGQPADAERALRTSLLRSSGVSPGAPRARALEDLALLLRQQGKGEESIHTLEEAKRIREALGDRAGLARVLTGLGNALHRTGAVEQSLVHHRGALELQRELGDRSGIARATANVGALLIEMADYATAYEVLEQAYDLVEESGEDEARAAVSMNLGLLCSYRGEGRRAEQYLRRCLGIREAAGDGDRAARCLNNLAFVTAMAGRDAEAIELARRSIELRSGRAPDEDMARPWFQIGASLLRLGRRDEAAEAAQQLRHIAEHTRNDDIISESLLLDARLALAEDGFDEALLVARRAEQHAGARNARARGEALRLQGEAHLGLHRLDLAREALLAGETILRGLPSPDFLASLRLTLGTLFHRAGAIEAAGERLRRAAEAYHAMGNAALEARALLQLGFAEWNLDRRRARDTLSEARQAAQRSGRAEVVREISLELEHWEHEAGRGIAPLVELANRLEKETDRSAVLRHLATWAEALPGVVKAAIVPTTHEGEGALLLTPGGRCLGKLLLTEDAESEGEALAPIVRIGATLAGFAYAALANETDVEMPIHAGTEEPAPARQGLGAFAALVGRSPALSRVIEVIEKIAPSDASVLIEGESGTGKELAARALHDRSGRAQGPFVAINCPTIPRELIEAELFGHEKGAFTGAHAEKPGQIEAAHGGTLFLDELGDMDQGTQVKLLRFLQEREFLRVGGRVPIKVDVRLVAATSRNLEEDVRAGRFREDLYYRLNVVPLLMPALRTRLEDVPLLVEHFVCEISARAGRRPFRLTSDAESTLRRYSWPGNVRELRNLIEYLSALHAGESVRLSALPDRIRRVVKGGSESETPLRSGESLDARLMGVEGTLLRAALEETGGNQSEAARLLGITESRLRLRLRRYGMMSGRPPEDPPRRRSKRASRNRGQGGIPRDM